MSGLRKHDTVSNVVAGTAFCDWFEKSGSFAKILLFDLCKNSFIIEKNSQESSIFSFNVSKLEEVSKEMLVLTLKTLKLGGSSCVSCGTSRALEAVGVK